jgi:gamma-glutamyltranspeptidase/glutathione hydrolase
MRSRSYQLAFIWLALLLPPLLLAAPAHAFDPRAEPEAAAAGGGGQIEARARHHMIVTANPHASRAGLDILRQGGSAMDAAIAAQMVLTLVEPQSSGLGGGAFLLTWDQTAGQLTSYDGRETAPQTATPDRFLKDGKPLPFKQAVPGGLSVGTPGVLAMLAKAYQHHGRLPWARLFDPAIQMARAGFAISPRLHALLQKADPESFNETARRYFFTPGGQPKPVGTRLTNPHLANTLSAIAQYGPAYFYKGPLAAQISQTVTQAARNPGDLSPADLATYRAVKRPPVCTPYRKHLVCGMGPPSSGMLTIAQILTLIEPLDLGKTPLNPTALHLIAEAGKLAYADRNRYMADSDFVQIPSGLLDAGYLNTRRSLIDLNASMEKAKPGQPPYRQGALPFRFGLDTTIENNGTSHISIIDSAGNAVSMTSSIEAAFGSRLMVGGFLLNNELTDFSFRPKDKTGRPVANRVAPLKRPRSSMAPVIVFAPGGDMTYIQLAFGTIAARFVIGYLVIPVYAGNPLNQP